MSTRAPDPSVARVAARLQTRVKPLADEITNLIAEQIDFYRSGSVITRADLRRSVEHNFSYMLGQLTWPEQPDLSAPRETGRLRAEQGAPLPEILRAYRLVGDDDPLIPLANAKLMQRLLPNATLHVYPDGHLGLITLALEIAPAVAAFLRPPK